MPNRRNFLKGLLSSIGGIMIVKPPSISDVIKEPEKPEPPEQPQRMFYGGSSCAMKLSWDIDPSKEPEKDGYVGSHTYPYSDDVLMADTGKTDGYVELSEEEFAETKRIMDEDPDD